MTIKKSLVFKFRLKVEKFFSKGLFFKIRKLYHLIYYLFEFIFCIFNFIIFFIPNLYFKSKKIYLFCFKKLGIGDKLAITPILIEYSKRGRVYLICFEDLSYKNLPIKIIKINKNLLNNFLIKFLSSSIHSNIIGSFGNYLKYSKKNGSKNLQERIFFRRKDVLKGYSTLIPPKIKFSKKEIKKYSKKYKGVLNSNYCITMSGSYLNKIPTNKNIEKSKIQEVIDSMNIKWVQLGVKDEPRLNNVMDMRGIPLRESFFLVSKAKMVFCVEGMFTHVAAAFNIPCVSIYTGFHNPKISNYRNIIPIQPNPLPDCAYCWDHICKKTGTSKAQCSKNVNAKEMKEAIKNILNKQGVNDSC